MKNLTINQQQKYLCFLLILFYGSNIVAQTAFIDLSGQLPPTPLVTDPSQGLTAQTNTADIVFLDIEGDGDLDVYIAEGTNNVFGRENRLLENDGNGVFTDITSTNVAPTSNAPFAPGPSNSQGLAAGDIDQDGDIDIIIANLAFNELLLNDGNGVFSNASNLLPAPIPDAIYPFSIISTDIELTDVDNDGDTDILVAQELPPIPPYGPAGLPNLIYIQQADGTFTDETFSRLPAANVYLTLKIVALDLDNDGDDDLVEFNFGQNQILMNDGNGFFIDETNVRLPNIMDSSRGSQLGDIDGDGDADIVVGNSRGEQNRILINDGNGFFTDETSTRLPVFFDTTSDTELFDIDLDGDLDIMFANSSLIFPPTGGAPIPGPSPNALYINDGNGFFTADNSLLPNTSFPSFNIGVADLDNDGFDDIFICNSVNTEEELFLRIVDAGTVGDIKRDGALCGVTDCPTNGNEIYTWYSYPDSVQVARFVGNPYYSPSELGSYYLIVTDVDDNCTQSFGPRMIDNLNGCCELESDSN